MSDLMRPLPRDERGFTIVEMMVTITVLAILMALAMPSMSTWIRNAQVRSAGDSLQNGLRLAQAEALRRSRQVVFSLTDSPSPASSLTAKENGKYWSINTVAIGTDSGDTDTAEFVEAGVLGTPGTEVSIKGPISICFSSIGRMAANNSPGVSGASCAASPATYELTLTGADRPLNVTVAIGGQVRMCDPAKTLSSSNPDGCPSSS